MQPPPPPSLNLVSLADAERRAVSLLPPMVLGYYASGAEDEETLAENLRSWRRWRILPRVLVDVSSVDTSTSLKLASSSSSAVSSSSPSSSSSSSSSYLHLAAPILVAPMAMMKLAHVEGEIGMARAAASSGLGLVVSTMGTTRLEDVAAAFSSSSSPSSSHHPQPRNPLPPMMFQLYVTKDRAFCESLVKRAERAGYQALVVTVDVPVLGKREADERTGFALPPGLALANLEALSDENSTTSPPFPSPSPSATASASVGATAAAAADDSNGSNKGSRLAALFQRQIDASLTYEFLSWLRARTNLPIWVKGVLHPDDAAAAVGAGADGIVCSNHGGRQLDGAPAAADVLEAVVAAVRRMSKNNENRIPVLVDGGIRRGSDVLRALCLGADAVLLGRPALYGLALGGEKGASEVLELLKAELARAMALAGCRRVSDACRGMLLSAGELPIKPKL